MRSDSYKAGRDIRGTGDLNGPMLQGFNLMHKNEVQRKGQGENAVDRENHRGRI